MRTALRVNLIGFVLVNGLAAACVPSKPLPAISEPVAILIDMPKVQTFQFLKQSASTLRLSPVSIESADALIAGRTRAVITGPESGPVTVKFSGPSDESSQWITITIDKLPAKKL